MQHQSQAFLTLSSFCQNYSPLNVKVALLTFFRVRFSDWTEIMILSYEYIQLISQALLHHLSIYKSPESSLSEGVIYFFKLLNPSYLLSFQQYDLLTPITLLFVFICTILKYILFVYIIFIATRGHKANSLLIILWRWTFRCQGRIIYFLTTSFWIKCIFTTSNKDFSILGMNSLALHTIAIMMVVLECMFSGFMETQFCYILPTKNFLSSKNYDTQHLIFIQKFLLQVIQLIFGLESYTGLWILKVVGLVLSLLRCRLYYRSLPLYKFQALIYQGGLLSIVACLNLTCLLQSLLSAASYHGADINFVIVTWIILSILSIKVSHGYLKHMLVKLTTRRTMGTPELCIHKIFATELLDKAHNLPNDRTKKYDWAYLLRVTEQTNLEAIFSVSKRKNLYEQASNKKEIKATYLEYLELLSNKFPRCTLVKLLLAKMYIKQFELYAKGIKIIADLHKKSWSRHCLSSLLLLHDTEKIMLANDNNNELILDLITYIRSKICIDRLKKEMIKQVKWRIKICNNVIGNISDIGEIFNCALSVYTSKMSIQNTIEGLPNILPDHYIEPLFLCCEYYRVLDYNWKYYKQYYNMCVQRYAKYEKHLRGTNLTEENLYQNKNVLLILSRRALDCGQILYASKSIQTLCGGKHEAYTKSHVSSLFTPSFQEFYSDYFKKILETGRLTNINKTVRAYLYHKDRHMVEVDFYIRVHPYLTQDLYLDMLIRPVPLTREYFLIKENGDIEITSKLIADTLGISSFLHKGSSAVNVKVLSAELARINQAFNIVNENQISQQIDKLDSQEQASEKREFDFPSRFSNYGTFTSSSTSLKTPMAYKKALELYNTCTTTGKKIGLSSIHTNKSQRGILSKTFSYRCKVEHISNGPTIMKLFTFEAVSGTEATQAHETNNNSLVRKDPILNEQEAINKREEENENGSVIASENLVDCNETGIKDILVSSWSPRKVPNDVERPSSPMSGNRERTEGLFISVGSERKTFLYRTNRLQESIFHSTEDMQKSPCSRNEQSLKIKQISESLSFSPSSQSMQEKNTYKAFQSAVSAKATLKSLKLFFFIFYGVILATLLSQIALKIIFDSTMNDLVLKKDMLNYAQLRSFYAAKVKANIRGDWLLISAALTKTTYPESTNLSVEQDFALIKILLTEMIHANQGMVRGLNFLEKDLRDVLFSRDIRIFGSYVDSLDTSYENVTNFQAVDQFNSALQAAFHLPKAISMASYHITTFIIINTVNDFFSKNNEIVTLFEKYVDKGRKYSEDSITLGLIINPLLLLWIVLVLAVIIWRQYRKEKYRMLAFTKLHPENIKIALASFEKFQQSLLKEESFEIKLRSAHLSRKFFIATNDILTTDNYHKNHNRQTVKYSQTRARYYRYFINVSLSIAVLMAITIWNFLSAKQATATIYRRQNQLQFANHLSTRAAISYDTYKELFVTNNTLYVERKPPLDTLTIVINEMKDMLEEIVDVFREEDANYDPDVKALLYNKNECQRYGNLYLTYCYFLVSVGQSTGLISVLALYQPMMYEKISVFINADKKTSSGLLVTGLVNNKYMAPSQGVLAAGAQLIVKVVDANLTKSISDANQKRKLMLFLFSASLIMVSLYIWFSVLQKLGQGDSDFRKVVQVLPPNVIMSSFILRSILKDSSSGLNMRQS